MPRLPDASVLGARQAPRASTRIVVDRSGEILGEGLAQFGATVSAVATKMREDRDADVLFRTEAEMKDEYLKWESEQTKRRGTNAWGVTAEAEDWWNKARERYSEKLENGFQRKALEKTVTNLRLSSTSSLRKFEGEQQRVARTDSAKASITTSIDLAAAHHDDTAALANSRKDIVDRVNVIGDMEGWTPEQRTNETATALSRMHAQVIKAKVEKDPVGAKDYFDANKHEILGTQQADIAKVVNAGTIRKQSQEKSDGYMNLGLGLSATLAKVRAENEGELEDDIVGRVKTQFAEREAAKNLAERNVNDQLWRMFDGGTSFNSLPTGLLAQASPETRRALRNANERRIAGVDVVTDPAAYGELAAKAGDPTSDFKTLDLLAYRDKLSPTDMKRFQDRQARFNDDPDAALDTISQARQIERTATAPDGLGLDPKKDKERYDVFVRAVEDRIELETRMTGRKLNQAERQAAIDSVILEGTVPGMIWDSRKRAFDVRGTEDEAKFIPDGYEQIPEADRLAITRVLTDAKLQASPLAILRVYNERKAKK